MYIKDCNATIDPDDDPYAYHQQKDDEGLVEIGPPVVQHPDLTGMMDTVVEKVRQCRYIAGDDLGYGDTYLEFVEESWVSQILSGRRPDSGLALLIVSLPNLQTLEFTDHTWLADHLRDMISKVCWESHRAPAKPQSLSNLTAVTVSGKSDSHEDASLLLLFLLLPSVQYLTGRYLSGERALQNTFWRDNAIEEDEPEPNPTRSSLTEVSMEQSLLDSQCFEFLRRVPALRHFKYSHAGTGHVGRTRWWEPFGIVSLLRLYARHSLVSLNLTGTLDERVAGWDAATWEADCPFASTLVGSLAKFEVLATIRIDHDLFFDNDLHSKDGSQDFRNKDCVQVDRWKHVEPRAVQERVHSLVDMLPAPVETLSLVKPFASIKEALIMFAGLLEAKGKRFPRLREIRLEGGMLFEQDMVDAYNEAGIELK